jgi:phosphoribosylamine--glycine ligase
MLRLESDLLPYLAAAAGGSLKTLAPPTWRPEASICVVVAAPGYPQSPRRGGTIRGWDQDFGEDVVVFHAGTALSAAGELTAAGGRVLNVCARGPDLTSARERAYEALSRIDWPQGVYRTDIGWRGLGI